MKHRQEPPGDKNIIGSRVVAIRKSKGIKQREFLARLQTLGLEVSVGYLLGEEKGWV
ncbi:hypothetical protein PTQ21_13145 [Paenibacillus marchantiae]|uniref:hypothetical protein n=1 Tax=Paenibacillus marchantiae TaxID=3026433 RepID=UPI00237AD943|nr:hypothetical protein [Paenibacillus marchantiae]WDQ35117.1 hypothetical protein PTQ21_13145 [Paenibacillus marchantiae]